MKPSPRAARALLALALAAAAVPARAPAQEAEAWVLPRGLLELSATGLFTHYDSRLGLGDLPLGVELVPGLQTAAGQLTDPLVAGLRGELSAFFAGTTDPQPGALPDSLTAGTTALRLAADIRQAPVSLRYGLTRRLTIFVTVPFERRGTSAIGPYLAGGTVGLNPNQESNAAILREVDPAYGALGAGLLLPLRDSPEGRELQSRLLETEAADTLVLPTTPLTLAQLLAEEGLAEGISAEAAAALGLVSARRPYHLGDVQLGARFQLRAGPAGWPYPDSLRGRDFRTVVGARIRLPTGRSGMRFFTEVPPGGGHLGFGLDVLNDVFLSSRWMVNASASLDVMLPADVQRLAFGIERPFPADSALRTLRREPGPRLSLSVTPRWRLTDEISFSGEYALLAKGATHYSGADDAGPGPLEWRTGGAMHALGIGMRYSSLQAFARGRADVPFEVSLSGSRAVAGGGAAPDAGTIRITARIFTDPRRFRALLPGEPPDTAAPPAAPPVGPPADTLPSQVRPQPRPIVAPPGETRPDSTARPPVPQAPQTRPIVAPPEEARPDSAARPPVPPRPRALLLPAQPSGPATIAPADPRRLAITPARPPAAPRHTSI